MFKKYDAYKDSGVQWVGEIPTNWFNDRLGTILEPVSKKGNADKPLLSITREKGVILRDVEDDSENHNFIPDDLSNYKLIEKGQFGMNKMKAWQGSYGVSSHTGIVSPAYYVFKFIKPIYPEFFHWAIRSKTYISFFGSASDGVRIGQWDLSKDRMKNIPFVFPDVDSQKKIVEFIQDKAEQIYQAIAIKEQQIALLDERKQIVIQKAVTQGLNPNVAIKDSGVEWIGQIPEHWEILPLTKYSTRVDYRGKTPEKVEEGRLLVTTRNIKNGVLDYQISQEYIKESQYKDVMSRGLPQIGDILFTMEAPLGHSAIVDREDIAIAQRIIKFRFDPEMLNSYFVNYYFQTDIFQNYLYSLGTGSTALGIKASKLGMLKLIAPNLDEQGKIVEFLKVEEKKFNLASELIQQQIEKLKEYKTTLINDAVTGKIKVV